MKRDNLKTRLENLTSGELLWWLSWILALAVAITVATFSAYFFNFKGSFSNDQTVWGTFGDFVGGTLNPILSFLALIALLLTVTLQNRQINISSEELKLSRSELEATRHELARAAEAQEAQVDQQVRAAKIQAYSSLSQAYFQMAAGTYADRSTWQDRSNFQSAAENYEKELRILINDLEQEP